MGSICSRIIFLIYRCVEIIRKIRIYKSVSCGISLRNILRISNGISYGISYGYLTEYLTEYLNGYLTEYLTEYLNGISHGYLTEYLTEYLSSGCGLFSLRNIYVYTYVTGFLYGRGRAALSCVLCYGCRCVVISCVAFVVASAALKAAMPTCALSSGSIESEVRIPRCVIFYDL